MENKITKLVSNYKFWIIVAIWFAGFLIGWFVKPTKIELPQQTNCLLTPDEACKLFYDCEYGYGTLGNLHCYCNDTWKIFGYKDLVKVIK